MHKKLVTCIPLIFVFDTSLYSSSIARSTRKLERLLVFLNNRPTASSKASSPDSAIYCSLFKFPVTFLSSRSSSNCWRLLPRLPITSILPSIFPPILLLLLLLLYYYYFIIIIILAITFLQIMYNYIHETNHVSSVYNAPVVLYIQFVLRVMLFRPWNMLWTLLLLLLPSLL